MSRERVSLLLERLGAAPRDDGEGEPLDSVDPATNQVQGRIRSVTRAQYDARMAAAARRFEEWRLRPAPKRGEVVRALGDLLRAHKAELGELVSLEAGKIRAEGLGEVQEMIDICDFAVGLSRQLHGLTIASERPRHRLMEQWHPLGPVGIVTAFNFPVAVWSWNAALAAVCGDSLVWKPSEKTPLSAMACQALLAKSSQGMKDIPPGLSSVVIGGRDVGQALAADDRVPLVSATGS